MMTSDSRLYSGPRGRNDGLGTPIRRRTLASVGLLGALLFTWSAVASQAGLQTAVDHGPYDTLLKRYVDADGFVDYQRWKANDRGALTAYLAALGAVDPATLPDRNDRLAFWINAYNALTIDAILHFYPVDSIKDKVSRLFGYNVWDDYPMEVAGREYSLNAIEHEVLRPMGEPRIHFAIVCASRSCPQLRREAYVADRLDAQLDDNTRQFFATPDRFRIDRTDKTVYLSPIFKWFGVDFGGTDDSKIAFARRFVGVGDREFLETPELSVRYLPYDWSLNEQSRARTGALSPETERTSRTTSPGPRTNSSVSSPTSSDVRRFLSVAESRIATQVNRATATASRSR